MIDKEAYKVLPRHKTNSMVSGFVRPKSSILEINWAPFTYSHFSSIFYYSSWNCIQAAYVSIDYAMTFQSYNYITSIF